MRLLKENHVYYSTEEDKIYYVTSILPHEGPGDIGIPYEVCVEEDIGVDVMFYAILWPRLRDDVVELGEI